MTEPVIGHTSAGSRHVRPPPVGSSPHDRLARWFLHCGPDFLRINSFCRFYFPCIIFFVEYPFINPRPAGVWLVTRPAGGGPKGPPPEISQTTGPISKFQTPFNSPVRELPVQGQIFDPEVTDDVTGQVKVRIFDFSGLATSASKISMLSANKGNESAWIVSLTSVSIISCALWP